MKDDFLKKIKDLLSGSLDLNSKIDHHDTSKVTSIETNEELVNNFMNQILDSSWVEDDLKAMNAPSYHLSKKNKSYWLMNTTLKSLFNIKGGVEIIPLEQGKLNTVCLIGQSTFSIPNKYIVCSGWN